MLKNDGQLQEAPDLFGAIVNVDNNCLGLVYRARRTQYVKHRGIEEKVELYLMKSLSCPGCEKCEPLLDEIEDMVKMQLIDFNALENGKLYAPRMVSTSYDRETGYFDDFEIVWDEVKENITTQ